MMELKRYTRVSLLKYYMIPVLIYVVGMVPFTFGTTIWGDEGFTLLTLKQSTWQIIKITASDVHPPLYYLICKIFVTIFGNTIMVLKWVSIIPILLALVKILGFCKKRHENPSIKMGVLCALCLLFLPHMIGIATELRMYSWAMFFVTSTGITAIDICRNNFTRKSISQITLYALGAAYTHYFALISVAIIILLLCIDIFFRRRTQIKYCLGVIGICSIAYTPWLFILYNQMQQVSSNYWISSITLKNIIDYMQYPFDAMSRNYYVIVIIIIILCNLRKFIKNDEEEKNNAIIFFGIVSIYFLTVMSGVILSVVIRPIFVIRYASPCILLFWIGMLIGITNTIKEQKMKMVLIGIILLDGVFWYNGELSATRDKGFASLVEYASESISMNDIIFTNNSHFEWTILPYYLNRDDTIYISNSNDIYNNDNLEDTTLYYIQVVHDIEGDEAEIFSCINGNSKNVFSTIVPFYGDVNVWEIEIK